MEARKSDRQIQIIGWREWVSFPELGIRRIKAKVDTGARSSTIHAFGTRFYSIDGEQYVEFTVHPEQNSLSKKVVCNAKILEFRKVKSSNGESELRPVILTEIKFLKQRWPIEITLSNRDEMGFRMLLGRQSFRRRFLVDAGRSFYGLRKIKEVLMAKNRREKKQEL